MRSDGGQRIRAIDPRRYAVAVAVAVAAPLVAVSPTHADSAGWGPEEVVHPEPGGPVDVFAELAMASDGAAVAVWNRLSHGEVLVEGARRPPGGQWSAATVLARTGAYGSAGMTDLHVDAAGRATVGYSGTRTGREYSSLVLAWDADGDIGPTTELDRGALVFGPLLYGDAEGDVLAVVGNGGDFPDAYYRPLGGEWSDRARLPGRSNPSISDYVLGPGDEVRAVWRSRAGRDLRTAALTDAGWDAPQTLASGRGDVADVEAEANADGHIGVTWARQTPSVDVKDRIESAFRPAGGPWGGVEVVRRSSQDVEDAVSITQVGVDGSAEMTVAWREVVKPSADRDNQAIKTARRSPSGVWTDVETLARRCDTYGLWLAVNDRGDALVACDWMTLYDGRIYALHRPAGGAWSERIYLTESRGGFDGGWIWHHAALSDSGHAAVLYQEVTQDAIWSRSRQVGPPGG